MGVAADRIQIQLEAFVVYHSGCQPFCVKGSVNFGRFCPTAQCLIITEQMTKIFTQAGQKLDNIKPNTDQGGAAQSSAWS